MARGLPKPWLKSRPNGKREYYVTITVAGKQKQVFLAEEGVSDTELQRLLVLALNESCVGRPGVEAGFVAVMNQYLDFVKENQSKKTFKIRMTSLVGFRQYLQSAGLDTIACTDLIPNHVTRWLAKKLSWGPTMKRMAVMSVKTCVNWAFSEGILEKRILERLKTPTERTRGQEIIMTAAQRQLLVDNCRTDNQRDILIALYSSGCRPGEICGLKAEDVKLERRPPVWIVRGKPTKHRPDGVRLVALTQTLIEMSKKLLAQNPRGNLFRNRAGTAWHPGLIDAFLYRLANRLRKQGHELPEKVCPYALRHNFATDLLAAGVADYDISKLMGHSGTKTLHQVYSKHDVATASRALEYLKETPSEKKPDLKVFPETA